MHMDDGHVCELGLHGLLNVVTSSRKREMRVVMVVASSINHGLYEA